MEGVTASARVRGLARDALLACGARGFVRFLPPGGALLATDAIRRGDTDALRSALCAAGFECEERGGLLEMSPTDELLRELAEEYAQRAGDAPVDWESSQHPVMALGRRWMRAQQSTFTPEGRQLALETLRLLWQGAERAMQGLDGLRARAAAMQRTGDRSGMHEAGVFLLSIE